MKSATAESTPLTTDGFVTDEFLASRPTRKSAECSATTPEASHAYRQPGVYTVTLRVERTLPEDGTETSAASAEVEVAAFCRPCLPD